MEREIRYCTTEDGVRIAYCIEGDGAPTILALPAIHESFSLDYLMPVYQQFYRDLGAGRRVIRFDWRGTGLSAEVPEGVTVSRWALQDVEAVAGAIGRCVVWAPTTSGPSAIALTAAHPDLVEHLILYDTYAVWSDALPPTLLAGLTDLARANWEMATQTIADMNGRREFPGEAAQLGEWFYRSASAEVFLMPAQAMDARPLLSQAHVPTLILHRIADSAIPFAAGQKLAAGIPGARFVPLEGKGHLFCLGDYGNILAAVDEVLGDQVGAGTRLPSGTRVRARAQGMAVVLFTDIADSVSMTERMGDAGFRAASRTLEEHIRLGMREAGGKPVEGKVLGDGVMGVFASAAQAIAAARMCADAASSAELPLHIGLHAGDVIHEKDNVYGGAVNIASRICGLCAPGEILVSQTVRDLARTSAGVTFDDRGEQALKGIADAVRVFAVRPTSDLQPPASLR